MSPRPTRRSSRSRASSSAARKRNPEGDDQNADHRPVDHPFTAEGGEFEEVIREGGGATGMFTALSEPGEYHDVCKFHPEMVDTLVVG